MGGGSVGFRWRGINVSIWEINGYGMSALVTPTPDDRLGASAPTPFASVTSKDRATGLHRICDGRVVRTGRCQTDTVDRHQLCYDSVSGRSDQP